MNVRLGLWMGMAVGCGVPSPDPRVEALEQRVATLDQTVAALQKTEEGTASRVQGLQDRLDRAEQGLDLTCRLFAESQPARPAPAKPAVGKLPPIPRSLSTLVTDAVIRDAVRQGLEWNATTFETASFLARRHAFGAALGDLRLDPPTYDLWRARTLQVARRELRDPDRLWATYQRNKDTLVAALSSGTNQGQLRSAIRKHARLFEEPVSDDVVEAVRELDSALEAWHRTPKENVCYTVQQARYHRADDAMKATGVEAVAVRFRWRRQAEGGDALVAAWGRVFADLASAVKG